MEKIFTAVIDDKSFVVEKFTREGIYFSEAIGESGTNISFKFCVNADGIALELPVSGRVMSTATGCLIPVQFSDIQSSAIRALFGVKENSNPQDLVKILYLQNVVTRNLQQAAPLASMGVMAVVCLVLMGLISHLLLVKRNQVTAIAAFVATDALVLESSASGMLEYVAQDGEVKTGEVYAAVRTKSDQSVFFESSKDGTILNAGARTGGDIRKGNPLIYVSTLSDGVFVKAYVSTGTAVKLLDGYSVEVEIGTGKNVRTVTAASIDVGDITSDFQFADQNGSPLTEVILPLESAPDVVPGHAVKVRFLKRSSSFFGFGVLEFGHALQNRIIGIGS